MQIRIICTVPLNRYVIEIDSIVFNFWKSKFFSLFDFFLEYVCILYVCIYVCVCELMNLSLSEIQIYIQRVSFVQLSTQKVMPYSA